MRVNRSTSWVSRLDPRAAVSPRKLVVSTTRGRAVPVPARVADPLPDLAVGASVEGDDAGVVHHLVEDHDVAGSLCDEHVVVVRSRGHRRPRVEAEDATVRQAAVGVVVGEAVAQVQPVEGAGAAALLAPRQAAVGRVDDQRGPLVGGQLDPALVPELVVGQHPALGPRLVAGVRRARLRVEQVAVQPRALGRLERGGLLGAQVRPAGQRRRPLERRDGAEREDSRDVRIAVRRPLYRIGLRRDRRGDERHRQAGDAGGHTTATEHVRPPSAEPVPAPPRRNRGA